MGWLLRPSILVAVSVVLALGAAAVALWPRAPVRRPVPHPVAEGDQEVVWLYAATNHAAWERFVTAVTTAAQRLEKSSQSPGLLVDLRNAFPAQTTAVPELSLSVAGIRGRLWFRWYKLTSEHKTQDWVRVLVNRRPAPLAVIGGNSSDLAIEMARSLREEVRELPEPDRPLLLLTTATADDEVSKPRQIGGPLNQIYPGRTYRFCFTNRQMAEAVTDFIWSQDELRPDADPLYVTWWQDDPYSVDLTERFCNALRQPAARAATRDWVAVAASRAVGGLALDLGSDWWGQFRLDTPVSEPIAFSVGTFDRPNRWEAETAQRLMRVKLSQHAGQQRPLLVIPATSIPSRRFLRALVRTAPVEARRFVVATGDSLAFNTVYRDRNVAWPIQDLPFPLVFFCHRNPVDETLGFRPESSSRPEAVSPMGSPVAGTEDLLLYVDILEALVRAAYQDGRLAADAEDLRPRLGQARWLKAAARVSFGPEGQPLFDGEGHRQSGTGEHVVYLRPTLQGVQVLPRASIAVWSWQAEGAPGNRWWRRQALLPVDYDESSH
jgi:hypothetical protein